MLCLFLEQLFRAERIVGQAAHRSSTGCLTVVGTHTCMKFEQSTANAKRSFFSSIFFRLRQMEALNRTNAKKTRQSRAWHFLLGQSQWLHRLGRCLFCQVDIFGERCSSRFLHCCPDEGGCWRVPSELGCVKASST